MDLIIEDKIRNHNPDLTEVTLKSYISNITKIMEMLKTTDLDILYKDPKYIITKYKEAYKSENSQTNKYTSTNAMLRTLITDSNREDIEKAIKEYCKEIKTLRDIIDAKLDTHEPNEQETNSWITVKEEKLIAESLFNKIPNDIETIEDLIKMRNYVIFIWFKNIATRTEICDSKIFYDTEVDNLDDLPKNINYVILKKKEKKIIYLLNVHKTVKQKGIKTINLGGNMYKIISKYYENLKKFTNDNWFLINIKKQKVSRSSLTKIYASLGEVLGRSLSIRTNRHIKITNNVDIMKLEKIANNMDHSVATSIKIYAKRR
jgi:hypothetical protein